MLHEPASSPDYSPPKREDPQTEVEKQFDAIRKFVQQVLVIHQEFFPGREDLLTEDLIMITRNDQRVIVSYAGELRVESGEAYEELDKMLAQQDMFPIFRENRQRGGVQHVVHVVQSRFHPERQGFPLTNLILFIATVVSVFITGMAIAIGEISRTDLALAEQLTANGLQEIWRGYPYALSIMLILVAHEGSHYLMMRRYQVMATLPYFLPLPFISPFGTLGAAIMLKGPIRNRKHLFDIGASGPIAGMIFAIPILLIGLATSPVLTPEGGLVEGNSILYALSKIAIFGEFLPNGEVDVFLNQLAWAGWTGFFVTALNLIPIGQLDGGHVIYSLLGSFARRLYYPMIGVMVLLIFFVSSVWIVLFLLLLIFGRFHAVPLDGITPLDDRRRLFAIGTLLLFVLIFVPVPLTEAGQTNGLLSDLMVAGVMSTSLLMVLRRR